MKYLLFERTFHTNIIENFIDSLVSLWLSRKSEELIKKRGFPIAVFGNDWIGTNIFISGIYEVEYIEDLFSIVNKIGLNISEMTIADVGANIGNHTLQFSKKFARVLSFEPNPRAFEILSSNTQRIKNISSFNIGLGSENDCLKLNESYANMGGSSAKLNINTNFVVDIQVRTLDLLSDTLGKIDVIKIDVEGMELDVLRGAIKVISRDSPIICHEQLESEFNDSFNETASLDMLRSLGYRLFAYETKPSPWLTRRLKNVYELFFGKTVKRAIYEFEKIPKNDYSMIFAIHSNIYKFKL